MSRSMGLLIWMMSAESWLGGVLVKLLVGPVGPGVVNPRPVTPDVADGLRCHAFLGREQRCCTRFFSLLLREDVDSLVRGQPAALKHCRRNLWLRAWVDSCMLNERGPEEWFQVLELRICCCWLNDREHIVWFKVLELRISCFSMKDRGPEVRFWALESRICCCSKIGESWLSCEAHTQFQERGAVQVYRAGGSRGFCPEVAFIKAEGVNKWDYGALQLEWVKLWLNGINWGQRHRARVMLRSWSLQVAPNRSVR